MEQNDLGRRADAISSAISRLHRQYYGRGATRTRTVLDREYVITFLEDIYTPAERTLIDAGEEDAVKQARWSFQRTMEQKFSEVVEEIMGRKVVAFLSQVHFGPDVSAEIFVLEPDGDQPTAEQ